MSNNQIQITEETTWCPGCGNFPLRKALMDALNDLELKQEEVVMFTGIGQAAKMPHYINVNGFNGLHGRSLPPAIGMRVANHKMKVIVESGDGCTYGEGGNHILHNIRRNPDIVHLVHDNQIYGLTKGQASPTTGNKNKTAVQPDGVTSEPFKPVQFALGMKAGFVARGFVGEMEHLKELIKEAFNYRGYALIDILQPCVSFNKINTFQWYKERVYKLDKEYDQNDYEQAFIKGQEWGSKIPIGVFYREEKDIFLDKFKQLEETPLVDKEYNKEKINNLTKDFK